MSDFNTKTNEEDDTLKNLNLLLIGVNNQRVLNFAASSHVKKLDSIEEFVVQNQADLKNCIKPDYIILDSISKSTIERIRENILYIAVPILIVSNTFEQKDAVDDIADLPRLLICNSCAVESVTFKKHLVDIAEKKQSIFPTRTGLIVKYTIFFINTCIKKQLTRGMLAEKVGVTEDYLTRIFHQEMGVSLWNYLNDVRMGFATDLLLKTDDSIYLVAEKSGFPDAAYFNRVFRKQFGITPGNFRKAGIPAL